MIKKSILVLLLTFSFFNITKAREIESNVIILMDFSNSYFVEERKKAIKRNINKITKAIASKKNGPEKPTLVQVIGIHDVSQQSGQICNSFTILRKKLINKKSNDDDPYSSTKAKDFKAYMNTACLNDIMKEKARNATDIQGAISLAYQLGESQTDNQKYIVIFSDMFEYRHEELPVTKADLTDYKILVVCSSFLNEENKKNVNFCMNTESKWASTFKKMGASEVLYTIETGDWDKRAAKDFFEN